MERCMWQKTMHLERSIDDMKDLGSKDKQQLNEIHQAIIISETEWDDATTTTSAIDGCSV